MTDFILPPDIFPAGIDWELVDFSSYFPNTFGGSPKTYGRGQRWQVTIRYENLSKSDRARMTAFASAVRGKENRVWLQDASYLQRGSFPGGELFSPASLAGGWAVNNGATSAISGRTARLTTDGTGQAFFKQANVALPLYSPIVLRSLIADGLGSAGSISGNKYFDSQQALSNYSTARGLVTTSTVVESTPSDQFPLVFNTNITAGNFMSLYYATLQQCGLVDNGENQFAHSNEFSTSPWSLTNATINTGISGAPDGSSTLCQIVENATNGLHCTGQTVTGFSSGAANYALACTASAGTRGWVFIELKENTGSTFASAYFNLSTGAVGITATGANWANLRTFVVPQAGGLYRFIVIARKTNAATSISGLVCAASANGTSSYAGVAAAAAINIWHASLAISPVPIRDTLTTTVGTNGTSPSGSAINLCGLPTSTNGLLLPGDRVDIAGELKIAIADLNSDASGLGYLQFEPAMRSASLADASPVVIGSPLGKFVLMENAMWPTRPGFFSDLTLKFAEA